MRRRPSLCEDEDSAHRSPGSLRKGPSPPSAPVGPCRRGHWRENHPALSLQVGRTLWALVDLKLSRLV